MAIYREYAPIYAAIGQPRFGLELAARLRNSLPFQPTSILDLACGTGAAGIALAQASGAHLVGVDRSPEMLAIAQTAGATAALPATWICADLRSLPAHAALGHGQFDLAICFYDSLNYLDQAEDFALVCAAVGPLLRPGGWFVFDLNTRAAFAGWNGEAEVIFESEDLVVYQRLSADHASEQGFGQIIWFRRQADGRWERGEERHIERCWSRKAVRSALRLAGFHLLASEDWAGGPASAASERVIYIAERHGAPMTVV